MTKSEILSLISNKQEELKNLVMKSYELAATMEASLQARDTYGIGTLIQTGQSIAQEIDSLIAQYGINTKFATNNYVYFDLKWLFPSNVNWLYGSNSTIDQMNAFLALMLHGLGFAVSPGRLKSKAPFKEGKNAVLNFYTNLYKEIQPFYPNQDIQWYISNNLRMPPIMCLFKIADSFSSKGLDFWQYFTQWGNTIMYIYYSISGSEYNDAKKEKEATDKKIESLKNEIVNLTILLNTTTDPVPITVEQKPEPIKVEQKSEPIIVEQKPEPILVEQKPEPILIDQASKENDVIIDTQKPIEISFTKKEKSKLPYILSALAGGLLFLMRGEK